MRRLQSIPLRSRPPASGAASHPVRRVSRSWCWIGRAAAALGLLAADGWAQIGDRSDDPGVVQRSLVSAELIPPATPRSPLEALHSFILAPGIKLELAASEPHVQEPVAMAFDSGGRLWVVEMRGYMPDLDGTGEDAPVGRVVILSDRDRDGRYDLSRIFLDGLVLPRAILLVAGGALVGAPPELAYWRDTDGDGRADEKTVVATDYGVPTDPQRPKLANPERAPNHLTWAYDNWIYSTGYTKKFRYVSGRWETGVTTFRGQWGLSQDDYGRLYYGSNSDYLRVDIIPSGYLQRNPHYPRLGGVNVNAAEDQLVWPARVTPGINRGYRPEMLRDGRLKKFTAACAPWIYRGDLLPEFYGNAFAAEPSANFIRRSTLTREHGTVRARNAYEQAEFIASTDERFRPVALATGPDGALYFADLYRGVLQHRISVTSYLRRYSEEMGLEGPRHHGRIYRVVPADRPAPRASRMPPLTTNQWVEKLSHPNSWWRETAQRILVERRDPTVLPAIRRVAVSGRQPLGRVHALWTLEGIGELDSATVEEGLATRDPIVRAMAARLAGRFLSEPGTRPSLLRQLTTLARDPIPEVQLQAVLTLGDAREAGTDRAMAEIVRRNPQNTYLRDAYLSGLQDREAGLLAALVADPAWPGGDAAAMKILTDLSRGVLASREPLAVGQAITLAATAGSTDPRASAILDGLAAATSALRRPVELDQAPAGWSSLARDTSLADPLEKLRDVVIWPGKPGVTPKLEAPPLSVSEQARFEDGRTLFNTVCATCHQTSGRGLEGLAPPLMDSDWVLGSPNRLIRVVLHGLRGKITVLGQTHMGDMPAFGTLEDGQLASILTYVRRAWDQAASPITPEQIQAVRGETAGRTDAWSMGELRYLK